MGREINPFIIPFPVTIVTDEAEFAECVKSLGAEPPSIEGDAITVLAPRDEDGLTTCNGCRFQESESCHHEMVLDVFERAKKLAGIEGEARR